MWTTGTITTKTSTGPESASLVISLAGDAGEQDEMVLLVDAKLLIQSPDYIEQQIESKLQDLHKVIVGTSLIDKIKEGTVYSLVQENGEDTPFVLRSADDAVTL